MSIRGLTNPENSKIKIQPRGCLDLQVNVSSAILIASQTNLTVKKFYYPGNTQCTQPTACKVNYYYGSGVIGNVTLLIMSSDKTITYFSLNFQIGAVPLSDNIITLTKVVDLPAAEACLLMAYSTDGTFNHPSDTINSVVFQW